MTNPEIIKYLKKRIKELEKTQEYFDGISLPIWIKLETEINEIKKLIKTNNHINTN